jgi:cell division septal protein FtsQ
MDMSAALDPALVLRRRALRRSEGKRRLAVLVGVFAIMLLPAGYWALEHSSVFSASRVMVAGATPRVDALVRRAVARDVAGHSLLQVNASSLAARLETLPDVRAAYVDRAFPHTVAVTVVMERAAAFVRDGKARYVVSQDGRVLRSLTHAPARLPRFVLPVGPVPVAGRTVDTAQMHAALQVLQTVPPGFERDIARLRGVVSNPAGVVAVFGHGLHIRLGDTSSLPLKLRVAARVLSKMGSSIRGSVAYVDVSAPARPAIGYKK